MSGAEPPLAERPWAYWVARVGFASKGVVYVLIGWLGLISGVGTHHHGGEDPQGALRTVLRVPFGRPGLLLLAVGMAAYTLWRLLETFLDPDHRARHWQGLVRRVGCFISAIGYGFLSLTALRLFLGSTPVSQNDAIRLWVARALGFPGGRVLVGLVGLVFVGVGIGEAVNAWTRRFCQKLELERAPKAWRGAFIQVARVGLFTRTLIFGAMGGLLVVASVRHDPRRAHGPDAAFATVSQAHRGLWVIAALSLGLFSYAVLMFLMAKWPRHPAPPR